MALDEARATELDCSLELCVEIDDELSAAEELIPWLDDAGRELDSVIEDDRELSDDATADEADPCPDEEDMLEAPGDKDE